MAMMDSDKRMRYYPDVLGGVKIFASVVEGFPRHGSWEGGPGEARKKWSIFNCCVACTALLAHV